jgi:Uma2 family endonuclease
LFGVTLFLFATPHFSFDVTLFLFGTPHFSFDVTLFLFGATLFLFASLLFLFDVPLFLFASLLFLFDVPLFLFEAPLFLFDVTLFLFDVTLLLFEAPLFLFAVTLFLFDVTLFSFASPLFSFASPRDLSNTRQSRCSGQALRIRDGPAPSNLPPPTPCYLLSMLAHETPPRSVSPGTFDQRVILHGITWDQYEAVLAMRGESSSVRIAYFRGELELMSPSRDHESIKTGIARLVEAYAEERGLRLDRSGSMTLRDRPKERGVEPDECYEIDGPKAFPDFAIEVMWTGGGLDKLEIYRGFGVREVWIWRDGNIEVYGLGSEGFGESRKARFCRSSTSGRSGSSRRGGTRRGRLGNFGGG